MLALNRAPYTSVLRFAHATVSLDTDITFNPQRPQHARVNEEASAATMDKRRPMETKSELDLVRETLADDILTILATKDFVPPDGTSRPRPENLQRLLCAAVADLEQVDNQLHRKRLRRHEEHPSHGKER